MNLEPMNRRNFLKAGLTVGAGLAIAPRARAQAAGAGGADTLNIALVGVGAQGRVLINAILKIPDIRFRAVCDIWPYNQHEGGQSYQAVEQLRYLRSAVR